MRMIELTDRDFQDLCADEEVRRIIADANRNGRRAALGFWALLIVGLLMVGAGTWYAIASGWLVTGVIVGSCGVLIVYILAAVPLAMAGRAIKLPVYQRLAALHGLDYAALIASPPASRAAVQALFGDGLATESYTDYFHGKRLDAGISRPARPICSARRGAASTAGCSPSSGNMAAAMSSSPRTRPRGWIPPRR